MNNAQRRSVSLREKYRILISMKRIPDRYVPAFFLLLLLGVFPGIGKVIDDLRRSNTAIVRKMMTNGSGEVIAPRAGEHEIPADARGAIALLRKYGIKQYQLSHGVHEVYAYQRIVEGAWPIRQVEASENHIFLGTEKIPHNCKRKDEENGMVLAVCN